MKANGADVLAVARGEIGTVESPRGSNRQKYGKWYGMDGQPWCAMFVSWVFWHAGHPLPPIASRKGFAYVPDIVTWAKRDGTWNTRRPAPGDIVVYKFGIRPNHVGLVETVNADGSIVAIEGNTDSRGGRTGGQVMRQRRHSGIHGYVAVSPATPRPQPQPDPEPAPQVDPSEVTMFYALDNGKRYALVGSVIVGLSEADYQRCYAMSVGVPVEVLPGAIGELGINASNAVAKATATGKAQPWPFDRRK